MTVYLDASATAPLHPAAREAMLRVWAQGQANAASVHQAGARAAREVETAREIIATTFGIHPGGVIFTSGGTEANNLGIIGQLLAMKPAASRRVLTTPVEHSSVLASCDFLHRFHGVAVDFLPVDATGRFHFDPHLFSEAPEPPALIAVGLANAEVGSVNDSSAVLATAEERGVAVHIDAVQAAAQLPVGLSAGSWPGPGVTSLAIASHKFGGPQGVGALLLPRPVPLVPTMHGGSQEDGRRAGTSNVAGIAGFAAAVQAHADTVGTRAVALMTSRDELIAHMLREVPQAQLTGHPTERLPGHASFVFAGVSGESLLVALDAAGYAVSSGSACRAGTHGPSPVLIAMGVEENLALSALRFSLPAPLDTADIQRIVSIIKAEVTRVI
ncbi:MAG: cysteine desulfurase family protein [Corynebacterium sp.]|nr:cysteine desulfurase family protein [Corynebacterium sp.]